MDRRKSLKVLALGAVSGGLLLDACKPDDKKADLVANAKELTIDRAPEEAAHHKKLMAETFFTPHELQTITVLSAIIIPADEVSGSAADAGVPDFIEYIVKDKPEFQTPMRGGLRWLDIQCNNAHEKPFKDCTPAQQVALVDKIAYPKKAPANMQQGVSFFNLMRNLTATGFYTSEIGIKDVGYVGNKPNQWNGVPDEVLKQYGLAYSEKELRECVSFPQNKS
jgi:hypothetical protein